MIDNVHFPESELIPTIIKFQKKIAPSTENYLNEVESGHGRADVVFFSLDKKSADRRAKQKMNRVKSFQFLETLLMVNNLNQDKISVTQLLETLPYSENYIRTNVLKSIVQNNLGTISKDEIINLNFNYEVSVCETVAIEAKVSNWKRGLYQAYRYKKYAKQSYLAIYEKYIRSPQENIELFKQFNVGLIAIDPHLNCAEILFHPENEESSLSKFFQIYANESILYKLGYIGA